MRLAGRKALITGGKGGIGTALIAKLKREGATVTATDLNVDGIVADHLIAGDLLDSEFCDSLPAQATSLMDGLDLLINNAGVMRRGVITDASDDDYALTMAINVEAPFRLCRATIPIMEKGGGGAIVNVSSCWGLRPGPGHPLYVMSKAAVASLTQCLGRDHAHQNIRVNAVCPNEVNTPMLRTGFEIRGLDPDTAVQSLNESVPLGHIASPEEIANVAAFLASDEARYMCGALVEVNGGKAVS